MLINDDTSHEIDHCTRDNADAQTKDTEVTIRDATAKGASVKNVQSLVSAFEGELLNSIASAVISFREKYLNGEMPRKDILRGITVVDPFVFARIAQAFGHKTVAQTVNYIRAVAMSTGTIDLGLQLRARAYQRPALDPLQVAQYGNAYELIVALK